MKKALLWFLLPVALFLVWAFRRRSEAPAVPFSKATVETLSSTLSTNGKVEPIEFIEMKSDASGLVRRVLVHQGDAVHQGQTIAELSQPGLSEDLAAAEARTAQARADLATLRGGGPGADVAELEGSQNRLRSQRTAAQRNLESLQRLAELSAATRFEVEQARQAVSDLDVQIQSIGQRRGAIVGRNDLAGAEARVRETEANVQLAKSRLAQNAIRAAMDGVIYDLPIREGAYLRPGDPVASVGKLDIVRVRVYVDEPELGRVSPGQAVRITWDALPGKEWRGTVEKRPTEVVALGSRQVGEVLCTIDNPSHELVPGTNVNSFILTHVAQNALTIPKAAVHRENGLGVFVLQADNTVKWQIVKTGISDALRVEVVSGLRTGDSVAQPSDRTLKDGESVTPVQQ